MVYFSSEIMLSIDVKYQSINLLINRGLRV